MGDCESGLGRGRRRSKSFITEFKGRQRGPNKGVMKANMLDLFLPGPVPGTGGVSHR